MLPQGCSLLCIDIEVALAQTDFPRGGGGITNRAVKKTRPLKLACYLGVTSSSFLFFDSVNWPLKISTFLAGGNCIKEIDIGFKIN